jgi:5-methylcytosine-specific restriction endonuclease McrA
MEADAKKPRKPRSEKEKARARVRMRQWYAANKERALASQAVYRAEHADESKARGKRYYEANKATILAQQKDYYERNREHILEKGRAYVRRNSAAIQARVAAYIEAHPERHRSYCKAWEKNNPDAVRRKYQDRRARKQGGGGKLSPGLIPLLLNRQGGQCVYCPADITGEFHLDHRIALKAGGLHADRNIQLLCRLCNQRKGALDPHEFEKRLRYHRRFRFEWITRVNFISDRLFYRRPSTQTRSSAAT